LDEDKKVKAKKESYKKVNKKLDEKKII